MIILPFFLSCFFFLNFSLKMCVIFLARSILCRFNTFTKYLIFSLGSILIIEKYKTKATGVFSSSKFSIKAVSNILQLVMEDSSREKN
jgi:hypothetical protein